MTVGYRHPYLFHPLSLTLRYVGSAVDHQCKSLVDLFCVLPASQVEIRYDLLHPS